MKISLRLYFCRWFYWPYENSNDRFFEFFDFREFWPCCVFHIKIKWICHRNFKNVNSYLFIPPYSFSQHWMVGKHLVRLVDTRLDLIINLNGTGFLFWIFMSLTDSTSSGTKALVIMHTSLLSFHFIIEMSLNDFEIISPFLNFFFITPSGIYFLPDVKVSVM